MPAFPPALDLLLENVERHGAGAEDEVVELAQVARWGDSC